MLEVGKGLPGWVGWFSDLKKIEHERKGEVHMNFKKLTSAMCAGGLCLGFTAMGDEPLVATGDDFALDSNGGDYVVDVLLQDQLDRNPGWVGLVNDHGNWGEDVSKVVAPGKLELDTQSEEIMYVTDVVDAAGMTFEIMTTFVPADTDGLESLDFDVKTALMAWVATNSLGEVTGTNLMAWGWWNTNECSRVGEKFGESLEEWMGWYPLIIDFDISTAHKITVKGTYVDYWGHFIYFDYFLGSTKLNDVGIFWAPLSGYDNTIFKSVSFKGTGLIDYFAFDEVQDSFTLILESVFTGSHTSTNFADTVRCSAGFSGFSFPAVSGWTFDSAAITAFNEGTTLDAEDYVTIAGAAVSVNTTTTDGFAFTVTATYTESLSSSDVLFGLGDGLGSPNTTIDGDDLVINDADFEFTSITRSGTVLVATFEATGDATVAADMKVWLRVVDKLVGGSVTYLDATLVVDTVESGTFAGTITTDAGEVENYEQTHDALFFKDVVIEKTVTP